MHTQLTRINDTTWRSPTELGYGTFITVAINFYVNSMPTNSGGLAGGSTLKN